MTDSTDLPDIGERCETLNVYEGRGADHVATIEFDRPEARNALNSQFRSEFKEVLDEIQSTDSIRVVVLRGSEESNAFAAGGDLNELKERDVWEQRQSSRGHRIYDRVAELDKPVIAFLTGYVFGGGCELAQACDIRIARSDVKIGQPEIKVGLIPGGGGTQRLPRLVGEGQAMRLILTGETINAKEAEEIGLIDEVHDDTVAEERVYEIASDIASNSPVAVFFAKKAVKASSRLGIDDGMDYERELFLQLFASEDAQEGIDAFWEEREPEWKGR